MIYRFAYRTPFTKEAEYFKADSYDDALAQFDRMASRRLPIKCYLDYVWICNEHADPVELVWSRD